MKQSLLFILLSLVSFGIESQNLVVNGSFEQKVYCPTSFNQLTLKSIADWFQLNEGTPDHFDACSDKAGVPNNMFGIQQAQDGNAYAGMAVYSPTQRNYREYLSSKLTRPLAAGEKVCVEMWISTADYSKYVTDAIGIVLSKNRLGQERNQVIRMTPTMGNPRLHMLDAYDQWVLIGDVITAKGGEEFITIGNFLADKELKIMSRTADSNAKESNRWSYVYVDNISVKGVKDKSECSCENELIRSLVVDPPLELSEYTKIKLDAIYFDFDQDILTEQALKELDEVYMLLRRNKAMYMEISGHTDIIGNDTYNIDLSKRRAQRVIDHLVKRGIPADRLTIQYFGSSEPIKENSTDEGRAQNRRVEFQVLEKKYLLIQ